MDMSYDGVLVMTSDYVVMEQEEMTYVDGGGKVKVNLNITFTDNLCKAAYSAGVSSVIGVITGAVSAALGATLIGSLAIGFVVGVASSILASYLADTKNIKGFTKKYSGSFWTLGVNGSINSKIKIGW